MASLKNLLGSKSLPLEEENLERGRIYAYENAVMYSKMCNGFCFVAPSNGLVIMETWGSGGSGAEMCCCGGGVPGNSGAYLRKDFNINGGQRICGCIGKSCNNADSLCFRGCSEPTMTCYFTTTGSGCTCAEGGRGGLNMCSTGSSLYCCFRAQGLCVTGYGPNCGIVCNWCANGGGWIGCAYGGDVNCKSKVGCVSFFGCYPQCVCMFRYHLPAPPGMFSKEGGTFTSGAEDDNRFSRWSGGGLLESISSLNGMSRNPDIGNFYVSCYRSNRSCGCYNMHGCGFFYPYGVGGRSGHPCSGVRDHGTRGGDGLVRIKFIEG
jgi:hypothetical protein